MEVFSWEYPLERESMFRVETKDDFDPRQTCMLMQDTFDDDDDDNDDQRNFLAPFNPVSRIKSHCHRVR